MKKKNVVILMAAAAMAGCGGRVVSQADQAGQADLYSEYLLAVEAYVRTATYATPQADINVAVVTDADPTDSRLAAAVIPTLMWNGGTSTDRDSAHFLSLTMAADADASNVAALLGGFEPNIVITFLSDDNLAALQAHEVGPVYIAAPSNTVASNRVIGIAKRYSTDVCAPVPQTDASAWPLFPPCMPSDVVLY